MTLHAERTRILLWAAALLAVCFALNQRHHHFPYYYHPDEPGKAEQILTGRWNFNHPMLMLTATRAVVETFHVPAEEQAIVEAGRLVSAFFMAVAVTALSLTAYLWRGWPAAILAGAALALHHQLYELSHYMKEDAALLMGLALSFLTCVAYAQRGSPGRALLIGFACGLAISGKYLGAVALAIALPVVIFRSPGARSQRLGLFALALIATLLLINYPLVADLLGHGQGVFQKSLHREVDLVMHGQGDVTRRIPHTLYWNVFLDNTTPATWLLLAAFISTWRHRRSQRPMAERLVAGFPFLLALALSFSPKENDRYFLPATAVFTLLAALGVQDVPYLLCRILELFGVQHPERIFTPQRRSVIFAAAASILLILQLTGWSSTKPGWWRYDQAFTRDDISELIAWMRENLAPTATVVADAKTGLRVPSRKKLSAVEGLPQRLFVSKSAADADVREKLRGKKFSPAEPEPPGSILQQLRDLKVDYVIVSESTYGRYTRENLQPKDPNNRTYARAKGFYEDLLRAGDAKFLRDRGTVIYLHPGIRVYPMPPG